MRAGLSRASHPGQSRWRGAIGGRDALHLLRKLRLCLPFRRSQVQYRRSLYAKVQPVLRPHESGQGPHVRDRLSNAGHFLRYLRRMGRGRRAKQGAKPVNTFAFGQQRVRTRNYVIMREQDEELDLMMLVEEADLGWRANLPAATADQFADAWVDAETAGIPQREAPPQPWAPRQPLEPA